MLKNRESREKLQKTSTGCQFNYILNFGFLRTKQEDIHDDRIGSIRTIELKLHYSDNEIEISQISFPKNNKSEDFEIWSHESRIKSVGNHMQSLHANALIRTTVELRIWKIWNIRKTIVNVQDCLHDVFYWEQRHWCV